MASAKQKQDIVVQIAKDFKGINICLPKLRKLVKTICNRFTRHELLHRTPDGGDTRCEISIAIVDDAKIRKVNTQFLNRKSTCDCLSFDLSDDEGAPSSKLFELVVNGEMAVKEANLRRTGTLHNARPAAQPRIRRLHTERRPENARYRR